ncbi:hypothetical protein DICPUDRAFT_99132 [Dictyostelium purpureum]|uniref:Uncharacterized protein n=1 Tax=Dictyostelium purpureum TaxID=5786 RepID=F0ZWJ6_DICPU|nr:uncharacterized protein DICPUDRAFT_99132 [Dictyostelium purpureum]EGC31687.1 hypothetical protein DICPUDRAFT_99132 [Dictyostelium purpureum]|eukprot:XP_003291785.1 hypothetical protein DICPUDRAFT_99132 [Dictyostelium purpureum]
MISDNYLTYPENKLHQYFFDQTTDKLDVSKSNQSPTDQFGKTEEYINSSSINILFGTNIKFDVSQIIQDHDSLPAAEKNLIKNYAKSEDIHGAYYILGVIFCYFPRESLQELMDFVRSFSRKGFRSAIINELDQRLLSYKHFNDPEIYLFHRLFTNFTMDSFQSFGSRFSSFLKEEHLITIEDFDPYQSSNFSHSSPVPSESSLDFNVNDYVFNNTQSVQVIYDNQCELLSPMVQIEHIEHIEQMNQMNQLNQMTQLEQNFNSIDSTPNFTSTIFPTPPSSPSFNQVAPSTPTYQFSPSPSFDCLSPLQSSLDGDFTSVPVTNSMDITNFFANNVGASAQPRASGKLEEKQKRVTKSFPKAVIDHSFRSKLFEFGFTAEDLEKASHKGSGNYIYGENLLSSISNTMERPIPLEVSTGRIARSGLIVQILDPALYPNVTAVPSLVSRNPLSKDFDFKKCDFDQIEEKSYHLTFSILRLTKTEKNVCIRLCLFSNGVHFDTITTPNIRFRNTPSEFSHPSEAIVLKDQNYTPTDQSNIDDDSVAKEFKSMDNFFKKGIKSTERQCASDGETIQKPGKQLVIEFKNTATNKTFKVPQDISKVPEEDKWRFVSDKKNNIINFPYSNVVEFKCIIPKGTYDVTFFYENVTKKISPQIKNYIIN